MSSKEITKKKKKKEPSACIEQLPCVVMVTKYLWGEKKRLKQRKSSHKFCIHTHTHTPSSAVHANKRRKVLL